MSPGARSAPDSMTLGTGKGKSAVNLGSTLPWTLSPPSVRGGSEIDRYKLLEFF